MDAANTVLSSPVLHDIVRMQADEIDRMRRSMMELQTDKDRLSHQISLSRNNIREQELERVCANVEEAIRTSTKLLHAGMETLRDTVHRGQLVNVQEALEEAMSEKNRLSAELMMAKTNVDGLHHKLEEEAIAKAKLIDELAFVRLQLQIKEGQLKESLSLANFATGLPDDISFLITQNHAKDEQIQELITTRDKLLWELSVAQDEIQSLNLNWPRPVSASGSGKSTRIQVHRSNRAHSISGVLPYARRRDSFGGIPMFDSLVSPVEAETGPFRFTVPSAPVRNKSITGPPRIDTLRINRNSVANFVPSPISPMPEHASTDEFPSARIDPVPEPETPRSKRPSSVQRHRVVLSESGNSIAQSLDQLTPFLTESKSPRKCVGYARTILKPNSTLYLVSGDYVFEPTSLETGFIVKPVQIYSSRKDKEAPELKDNNKWEAMVPRDIELLTCHKGSWYYFGTYKITTSSDITSTEFENLPLTTRKAVTNEAGASVNDSALKLKIPSMFQDGSLKAMKINLKRVGFTTDIAEGLQTAASGSQQPQPPAREANVNPKSP